MADIDMIPRSYRHALLARRVLGRYAAALALVLVAGGAGAGWLRWRLALEAAQLDRLRAASAQAEALRARVAAAGQRKFTLVQASAALQALRGHATLARLSGSIDRALTERVWFDQLQFSRTQELLRDPLPAPLPEGTLETQGAAGGAVEHWRLASHVEINGHALDHAAMTQFLGALAADPALADVRFLNSAATEGGSALAFGVAASLRPAAGGGAR
jgi:Tfp pilus assembly protein PilN